MNAPAHDQDRLLEYAYGELSPSDAKSLEVHLKTCSQCSHNLEDIRKVRRTMARLPTEPAPPTGMDSLLAYAQQAARRSQIEPRFKAGLWKWLLLPGTGALATVVLLVVSSRVAHETDLSRPQLSRLPAASPPFAARSSAVSDDKGAPSDGRDERSRETPEEKVAFASDLKKEKARSLGPVEGARPSEAPVGLKGSGGMGARISPVDHGTSAQGAHQAAKKSALAEPRGDLSSRRAEKLDLMKDGQSEGRPDADRLQATPKPEAQAEQSAPASGFVGGALRNSAATNKASVPSSPASAKARQSESLTEQIARLQQALTNKNLKDSERAQLLNQVCRLLYTAGRPGEADSACDTVLREFPGSPAAETAQRLKAAKHPPPPESH